MTYITVYNLAINSNYRNLAAELNYRFTAFFFDFKYCVKISAFLQFRDAWIFREISVKSKNRYEKSV